ncbi:unnamed protein product [Citrullus colocynthis]|uniref:Uncharacterized protein n=1 Tax=Citrullus colocynthis TaxID=252529 RepID=A0ABP0YH23_9ROSI
MIQIFRSSSDTTCITRVGSQSLELGCEIRVRNGGISSHRVYVLLFLFGMEEEDETNAEFSDTVSYDIRVMR